MEREEIQGMLNDLMLGIGDMLKAQEQRIDEKLKAQEQRIDEKLEKNKTEIVTYIENGVEKKVDLLTERVDAMERRQAVMEEQLGRLTEDMRVVKAAVTHHEEEIITLKRIK